MGGSAEAGLEGGEAEEEEQEAYEQVVDDLDMFCGLDHPCLVRTAGTRGLDIVPALIYSGHYATSAEKLETELVTFPHG